MMRTTHLPTKMNKTVFSKSYTCRTLATFFLLLLPAIFNAPILGARTNVKLNDTLRVGFNALDHVLQRPLPSPSYPDKSSPARFFISGGGGLSMRGLHTQPGIRGEFSLGHWITPVHGWRFNIGGGLHSVNQNDPRAYFGSVSADYLMNISTLLRGYDSRRMFELIGGLGVEYQRLHRNGLWGNELGARASLQARFNVSPAVFLYLEPRLALVAGTRFGPGSFRRFRPDISFFAGLGYRLLRGEERRRGTTPFLNIDDSHMFFSVGGGVTSYLRGASRNSIGPAASISVGKWLSSVAGLRLKADFGRYGHVPGKENHRYIASAGLDYIWNIASAFGGYRSNEIFGLNLNLGVAMAYGNMARAKFYPGIEGGLTASFRLSPNWSLYVEPQVQLFTRSFNRDLNGNSYLHPIGSLMAGVNYTFGNFYHEFSNANKDYLKDKHYFLTFAAAPAWRFRGNYGKPGLAGIIGFGKRFTPISSWRISADGEAFRRTPGYISLSLAADYLFSISTTMAGYNPDRIFDLSGVFGLFAGAVNYEEALNVVYGGKAGLHGVFRLNNSLGLFIEPQILALRPRGSMNPGWVPEVRVMAGLTYRLGQSSDFGASIADAFFGGDRRSFIGLSGGPTTSSATIFGSGKNRINGAIEANIGRWFSLVSGLRLGLGYDFFPADNNKRLNLGNIHLDYMLNITSLMDRNPARRFHIIGSIGGGVAISDAENSKTGAMGNAGIQFRYNLPANIDIHIEPAVAVFMNRTVPNYATHNRVMGIGRILAGASYRF